MTTRDPHWLSIKPDRLTSLVTHNDKQREVLMLMTEKAKKTGVFMSLSVWDELKRKHSLDDPKNWIKHVGFWRAYVEVTAKVEDLVSSTSTSV